MTPRHRVWPVNLSFSVTSANLAVISSCLHDVDVLCLYRVTETYWGWRLVDFHGKITQLFCKSVPLNVNLCVYSESADSSDTWAINSYISELTNLTMLPQTLKKSRLAHFSFQPSIRMLVIRTSTPRVQTVRPQFWFFFYSSV